MKKNGLEPASSASSGGVLTVCSSTLLVKELEEHTQHWSYSGDTGPEHWAELDSSFNMCVDGKAQSPINLEEEKVNGVIEVKIQINYRPSLFTVENNGHTVQAKPLTAGNTILLNDTEYKLVEFHFHVPSEHQMEGENLDMELHFVHKSTEDKLAVLGILIRAGAQNRSLAELWDKLPQKETNERIQLEKRIDLFSLLPQSKKAFYYNGSLTTPPCSEGVEWMVLAEPIEMSSRQIDRFTSIFPDNHRPIQARNDRNVYEVSIR